MSLSQYDVKRSEDKPDQRKEGRKEGIPLSCLLVYDSLSYVDDEDDHQRPGELAEKSEQRENAAR